MHVLLADEAVCIGQAHAHKSYLKMANIISACEITGADAVHPGYGFLSENANFASICESCNLEFIGPPSKAISLLGDKAKAKALAKQVKCPIIPGSDGVIKDVEKGLKEARKIGFPVFIKASAGGGGKGIRIAYNEEDFLKKFISARAEAESNFSNPDVYLEKMIQNPRHIEIQFIADKHGNIVHLGERDCTIQRRRQKLLEETPSGFISSALRKKMGQAAINIAKAAKYYSCGTVEFLIDEKMRFYFMEVNTRIQVEHTITEEVTGVDLVREQIQVAKGKKLSFRQKDLRFNGHVIQCRINAENPSNDFAPSPGILKYYIPPGGPHVRIDSACYNGCKISPYYDSMIAKLIVKGKDRQDAIAKMKRALKEFHIMGVDSTISFHLFMLGLPKFVKNNYTLDFVDQLLREGVFFEPEN